MAPFTIISIYTIHRCSFCHSNLNSVPVPRRGTTARKNPTSSTTRLAIIPTSSLQKNPKNSKSEPKRPTIDSLSKLRKEFRFDELGLEILSIALPAALALAADPIASLVDSAYVGHLGSVELAAVGVSISVFNLVAKFFNVPLLNITTSFVAEEQALAPDGYNSPVSVDACDKGFDDASVLQEPMSYSKKSFPAVSTSLALAAGIGIAEAIALSIGSGSLMNIMGISVDSPMRLPAEHFLALRAVGAPAIVIALAAQGTFRGFMDTKTPLYATIIGNILNAMLDPVLIFVFGLGIGGAAISTVISEYLIAFILLWELNSKVLLVSPNTNGRGILQYLKSGGLLIGRTIAILFTMTLATSMAARQGPVLMAGHQICMQVWLAVSLLTDGLALAGQALLASGYSQKNYTRAQDVIYRVLQIGLATGVIFSIILFLGFETFSRLFTTDAAVLEVARRGVLFVAGSQPINALAFVLDGLYYGVSDFAYAAYSMALAGLISSLFLFVVSPAYGLAGVWMGLFIFMTLRVFAGIWRIFNHRAGMWLPMLYVLMSNRHVVMWMDMTGDIFLTPLWLGTRSGPWKMVWSEMEQTKE